MPEEPQSIIVVEAAVHGGAFTFTPILGLAVILSVATWHFLGAIFVLRVAKSKDPGAFCSFTRNKGKRILLFFSLNKFFLRDDP
jgi:hypothetical protein